MALFEDKYGDMVRLVGVGDSLELCGGTHVKNTKDIGRIAIVSVENKGADTFRIEGAVSENIDGALRKLKVQSAPILSALRDRKEYKKPGVRRREEKKRNTINSKRNSKRNYK